MLRSVNHQPIHFNTALLIRKEVKVASATCDRNPMASTVDPRTRERSLVDGIANSKMSIANIKITRYAKGSPTVVQHTLHILQALQGFVGR